MERRITGPFADILKNDRDLFNLKFNHASRSDRSLNGNDFFDHLTGIVAPLVNLVAGFPNANAKKLACSLYDLSLALFAQGCFGKNPVYPEVLRAWKELFPSVPQFLAEEPETLPAAISNALINLTTEKSGKQLLWLDIMKGLAPLCSDTDTFLNAGKTAAWRCGMAHYREGALEAAKSLSPQIFARVIGLSGSIDSAKTRDVLKNLIKDPWYYPFPLKKNNDKSLAIVAVGGGFQGFGGPFITPPSAKKIKNMLYLYDDEEYRVLHADIFGATLHRAGKGVPKGRSYSDKSFKIGTDGIVCKGNIKKKFPKLAGFSSAVSTSDTLVVCLPGSHRVFLVAFIMGVDNSL
ncbi:hypothetical protein QUF76_02980 [Desulfobacterales bacterium HSG16]|nr:hypothetical protein [Desulfobacterales bacterium HSG16]